MEPLPSLLLSQLCHCSTSILSLGVCWSYLWSIPVICISLFSICVATITTCYVPVLHLLLVAILVSVIDDDLSIYGSLSMTANWLGTPSSSGINTFCTADAICVIFVAAATVIVDLQQHLRIHDGLCCQQMIIMLMLNRNKGITNGVLACTLVTIMMMMMMKTRVMNLIIKNKIVKYYPVHDI